MSETNGTGGQRPLAVYAVTGSKDGEKTFWPKIGVAFRNRDGSVAILLDALPLGTNKLQVREPFKEREDGRAPAPGQAARGNGKLETIEVRP
jgi:hypothetical protein